MKKRFSLFMIVIFAMAMVFSACSSSPRQQAEKTSTQSEAAKDKGSTKPAITEIIQAQNSGSLPKTAKDRKDTLIVGIIAPEGKFAPIYQGTMYDGYVCDIVFDTLLTNDEKGNPAPWVAKSWEISPDNKLYTFHLNKGIKFSSGDELTAEDVAFTFTAICDPKYDGLRTDAVEKIAGCKEYKEGAVASVAGIKVIDPYTISFTLSEVKAPALILMCFFKHLYIRSMA